MLKSRIGSLVMLASISACMVHMLVAKQELSFATIGTLHMRSFGLDLDAEKKEEEIKDIATALSVRLNDDDKRRLVYQICAKKDQELLVEDDLNVKRLVCDLDILFGQGQNAKDTIFNRLFEGNVRTFMGEAMAAKRIASVVTDRQQLDDYQQGVAKFIQDKELFDKVDKLLALIAKNEGDLLFFMQEDTLASKKFIDKLFFGKYLSFLNRNVGALEAGKYIDMCSNFSQVSGVYLNVAISDYLQNKMLDLFIPYEYKFNFDEKKQAFTSEMIFRKPYTFKQALRTAAAMINPIGGIRMAREVWKTETGWRRNGLAAVGVLWSLIDMGVIGLSAYQIKLAVSDFIQKRDIANFMHAKLISVAEYLRALNELHELAEIYPCLAQALPIEQVYERIFYSNSIEMQQLVSLLMTNTFVGKASFFSRTGRVLAAYTLMNRVKGEFFDCMQLIGSVDAAVAVAKLYNSFASNDKVTYSFAEYTTQNRPYIQAVDFWNPLVDPRVVVTNSMQLGQEGAVRNIILTGSNRGGKSTLLKATMLNALLAQTITVVPAKRYVATPFARLATYLNVTDDTAAGLSLFQAQVVRAKKLVEMIDALSPEQLGFVIIDEIFTGTGSKKASSAAFKVAEHMAQSDYLCFILATHFVDELTKLEEETHGLCKNFKVDADKDENGNIVFRHKLEEGVSTQNIANELLNDEFESIDFGPDKVAVA